MPSPIRVKADSRSSSRRRGREPRHAPADGKVEDSHGDDRSAERGRSEPRVESRGSRTVTSRETEPRQERE
eukprot:7691092-Alexandrium_andersonii.AAC.1